MKKWVLILCGALLLVLAGCAALPEPSSEPSAEQSSAAPTAPQPSEAAPAEPLPIVSRPLATAGEAYFRIEDSGRLIMWGHPDYGTLSAPESDPLTLLEDAVCVSVSPTGLPAMAIDRNGTLWGLCAPELYTALNPDADLSDPMQPVRLMEDVADVCCGQWASAILKRDGTLYIYGSGPFRLPGQEPSDGPATLTEVMSQVRAAAVSGLSAYAVGQDGTLWRWRDGSEIEKLLEGDFVRVSPSGTVLCADGTLMRDTGEVILTEAAEVGDTFAIREDGSLWVWGEWWRSWFPDLPEGSLTRPVQALDGVRAAAVCHSCLLLRTDGEITVLPQPAPDVEESDSVSDGVVTVTAAGPAVEGTYSEFLLSYQGQTRTFSGHSLDWNWGGVFTEDLTGDGIPDVGVRLVFDRGTGRCREELHLFDGSDLTEIPCAALAEQLAAMVGSTLEDGVLTIDTGRYQIVFPANAAADNGEPFKHAAAVGDYYRFYAENGRLYCEMTCWTGPTQTCGSLVFELGLEQGDFVCRGIAFCSIGLTAV